ncbi:MAG: AI-2E family transporter [Bacillota bacterium]
MELLVRRILLIILPVFFFLLLLRLLYYIRVILIPFILAILLAYILLPLVNALVKRKVPITLAILIIYCSVAVIVTFIALYVFPEIFNELNRFTYTVPQYTSTVQQWINEMHQEYSRFNLPESIRQIIDETIVSVESKLVNIIRNFASFLINLFSYSLSLIIVPILTFYFLKDHEIISKKIVSYLPRAYQEELLSNWATINLLLRKFIRGHLSVALIVGTLTSIGLAFLGVDYALTLGFIAGIADLIPYFGPIIGAIPAVCLAFLQSKKLALYVIIVMFIVQQIESSIISPKIIGDSVGLHPLVIIFVLLLGGYLFGILGMLFAVPITAVMRVIINFAYQRLVFIRSN